MLQERNAIIPLVAGLDTKSDPKAVPPPKLTRLENADFDAPGTIRKRKGYQAFDLADPDSLSPFPGDVDGFVRTATDGLLVYSNGAEYAVRGPGGGTAQSGSPPTGICVTRTRNLPGITAGAYAAYSAWEVYTECARIGDLLVVGFANGLVRVINVQTWSTIMTDRVANVERWYRFHPAPDGSRVYMLAKVGASVLVYSVALAAPSVVTSNFTLVSFNVDFLDATAAGSSSTNQITVAVARQGVAEVRLIRIDPSGILDNVNAVAELANTAVAVERNGTGGYELFVAGSGIGLRWFRRDSAFGAVASATLDAGANDIQAISVAPENDAGTDWVAYYSQKVVGPSFATTFKRARTATISTSDRAYGLTPVGKAVRVGARVHVPCVRDSATDSVYLLFCDDSFAGSGFSIVGKWIPQLAAGANRNGFVSSTPQLAATKFLFAGQKKQRVQAVSSSVIVTQYHPVACEVDFSSHELFQSAHLGPQAFIAGSVVGADSIATELGFLHPPAIAGHTLSSPGTLTAGAHLAVAVYEYIDQAGQRHQSAPSAPHSFTAAAGDRVSIEVHAPLVTHAGMRNVAIALYRRPPGAAAFHREADNFTAVKAATNDGTPQFARTASIMLGTVYTDAELQANERLYTDGGVLDAYPPPPTRAVVAHRRRLWCASDDDGSIWFSREMTQGEGVAFHPGLVVDGFGSEDRPVRLVSRETDLAVFWRNKVGVIFGDGPDDQGNPPFFPPIELIPGDLNGVVARSVVATPMGIFFADATGIKLLTRANEIVPIGRDVEAYRDRVIVAADLVLHKREVRFTCADGVVLTFDYDVQQWHVHTILYVMAAAAHAVYWRGQHMVGFSGGGGGYALRQADDTSDDDGNFAPLVIETPWLRLDGFSGLQRVWSVSILGKYLGPHQLTVDIAYDDGAYTQSETFSDADLSALEPYEVDVQLDQEECVSARFRITVAQSGEHVNSSGAEISALRLYYGVTPSGARKRIPAEARR